MISLPSTKNFSIEYDDSIDKDGNLACPHARARAEAVRQTCENDQMLLQGIFDVGDVFAATGVTVKFGGPLPPHADGYNVGYQSAPNRSTITINPESWSNMGDTRANERARAIFVHELAEILMSYRNQMAGTSFWLPSTSAGDGLATAVEQWLHPEGGGLDVTGWINGPRDVTCLVTPASDEDKTSDLCTCLFIRYLEQQLKYSRTAIVTRGGDTPEKTFQNLTLTRRSGGGAEMLALLARFFGAGPGIELISPYSPFPLLDPPARTLRIDIDHQESITGTLNTGVVTVSPAPGCPSRSYDYEVIDQNVTVTCSAEVTGAALPKFSWRVNGVAVNAHSGTLGPLLVEASRDDPQHPGNPVPGVAKITVNYSIPQSESALVLFTFDHVGRVLLTIEARVSEQLAGNGETIAATVTELVTQRVEYRPPFERDREICLASREVLAKSQMQPVPWFTLLRTLPDPPPDQWRSIGLAIDRARAELKQVAKTEPRKAAEMQTILEVRLGLPRGLLAPSPDQTANS